MNDNDERCQKTNCLRVDYSPKILCKVGAVKSTRLFDAKSSREWVE